MSKPPPPYSQEPRSLITQLTKLWDNEDDQIRSKYKHLINLQRQAMELQCEKLQWTFEETKQQLESQELDELQKLKERRKAQVSALCNTQSSSSSLFAKWFSGH